MRTIFFQGASSHWWNFRHFLHHAKPNIIKKDPDVEVANLFVIGDVLPIIFGRKKRGVMPYNIQHIYFFLRKYLHVTDLFEGKSFNFTEVCLLSAQFLFICTPLLSVYLKIIRSVSMATIDSRNSTLKMHFKLHDLAVHYSVTCIYPCKLMKKKKQQGNTCV